MNWINIGFGLFYVSICILGIIAVVRVIDIFIYKSLHVKHSQFFPRHFLTPNVIHVYTNHQTLTSIDY